MRADPNTPKKDTKTAKAVKRAPKIKKIHPNDEELSKYLTGVGARVITEKDYARKIAYRDVKILESIIEEYLGAFVLLGYDLKGDKIVLWHAKNQADNDSLLEHLRSSFLQSIGNTGG